VSNFVGNKMMVSNMCKYIQRVKDNEDIAKNILCLLGPDGSGKTTLASLLLTKYDFHVLEIGKDILSNENIKTLIENFTNNTTIEHYIFRKRKIIFVDDLDILLSIDRNIVSKIISFNKLLKVKQICMLITCNSSTDKKLFSDNEAEFFKLSYPSCKDAFSYIMQVFDAEEVEYNMEHLLQVVNKHKGNIRESILNINNTQYDLAQKHLDKAFKDMNNFEIAKSILSKKPNVAEIDHLVRGDTGNLPYILYENLPAELDANYKTDDILNTYLNVNTYFINAVAFDEGVYTTLDWGLLQYANILRTKSIVCSLNNLEPKATQKNLTYKFSQMRSKSSHRKILGKKVRTASCGMQTSENSLIVAADGQARGETANNTRKAKSQGKHQRGDVQEISCLISTYEKYFA
jgi:hypothetical protein